MDAETRVWAQPDDGSVYVLGDGAEEMDGLDSDVRMRHLPPVPIFPRTLHTHRVPGLLSNSRGQYA